METHFCSGPQVSGNGLETRDDWSSSISRQQKTRNPTNPNPIFFLLPTRNQISLLWCYSPILLDCCTPTRKTTTQMGINKARDFNGIRSNNLFNYPIHKTEKNQVSRNPEVTKIFFWQERKNRTFLLFRFPRSSNKTKKKKKKSFALWIYSDEINKREGKVTTTTFENLDHHQPAIPTKRDNV